MHPCAADHDPSPESCRLCWLAANDPRYQRLWGITGPGACVHLGAETGETGECVSCWGRVKLKVFGCVVHGTCTTGKQVEGVACCRGCPDACRPGEP
ncbi:MAG: hypothetical protein L0Z62_22655 [Gemmataceae bacterium]|nr:hypothetical protein [Gemmataceae bacterium]